MVFSNLQVERGKETGSKIPDSNITTFNANKYQPNIV